MTYHGEGGNIISTRNTAHHSKRYNMTLSQIFDELEKRANEIDKAETFKGDSKAIAEILLAGLTMMAEGSGK